MAVPAVVAQARAARAPVGVRGARRVVADALDHSAGAIERLGHRRGAPDVAEPLGDRPVAADREQAVERVVGVGRRDGADGRLGQPAEGVVGHAGARGEAGERRDGRDPAVRVGRESGRVRAVGGVIGGGHAVGARPVGHGVPAVGVRGEPGRARQAAQRVVRVRHASVLGRLPGERLRLGQPGAGAVERVREGRHRGRRAAGRAARARQPTKRGDTGDIVPTAP